MTSAPLRFTVFTATCNRARTLPRVYDSLRSQTFRDFEWLIVDDGSSDDTDRLVAGWVERSDFPIRYIRKRNGGKHTAFNVGVREARGDLFVALDSDDGCTPEALGRLDVYWEAIDPTVRQRYTGVTVNCARPDGTLVGKPFPADQIDSDWLTMTLGGHVVGEKWGFHRTAVLREHAFPEYPGERHVPEGLIWNRIARRYRMRFINDSLRIYFEDPGGRLTSNIVWERVASPSATLLYYRELMAHAAARPGVRLRAIVNYLRFGLHARVGLLDMVRSVGISMTILLLLPAAMLRWSDTRSLRAARESSTATPPQVSNVATEHVR